MSRFDLSIIVDDTLEREERRSGSIISLAGGASSSVASEITDLGTLEPYPVGKHRHSVIKLTWQYLASQIISPADNDNETPRPRMDHLVVSVSGRVFRIGRDRVRRFPDSVFCNPDRLNKYYQDDMDMYFFDRNRVVFEFIHQQLYSDKPYITFPTYLPAELIELELQFYGIGWRYFIGTFDTAPDDLEFVTFHERAFAFFNYPEWKTISKVYMYLDLVMIVLSIALFILETDPFVKKHRSDGNFVDVLFKTIGWICMCFFTLDLSFNFLASLDRIQFIMDYTRWCDFISILPFYIDLVGIEDISAVSLLKIARISRCLKIIRRSEILMMIMDILVSCLGEMVLLALAWLLGVLISGTLLYYAENEIIVSLKNQTAVFHPSDITHPNGTTTVETSEWFYSILESCWQSVVLIGTVGYGDMYAKYSLGKLVSTIIIFISSIFMAIPMTIIIKKFSRLYDDKAANSKKRKVVGGVFDERGGHRITVERRLVSRRKELTARSVERYRKGVFYSNQIRLAIRNMKLFSQA